MNAPEVVMQARYLLREAERSELQGKEAERRAKAHECYASECRAQAIALLGKITQGNGVAVPKQHPEPVEAATGAED